MSDSQDTKTRLAWAYLTRAIDGPRAALFDMLAAEGAVATAERVRRLDFPAGTLATEVYLGTESAQKDLAQIESLGGRLITFDDEEYPPQFKARLEAPTGDELPVKGAPPLALWVMGTGNLDEILSDSVCLTGTRAPSAYGERVADDLAHALATESLTIVNGGAYGVDGAAARAALAADGTAVVFAPCGLDRGYPAGHAGLFRRIAAEGGALVSEYAPGVVPTRGRFHARNRLIAAATAGIVVVEAGFRSGTKSTAGWAQRQGSAVCAVPGPVTSATSVTCHQLIRDGATLVTNAAQVLEAIAPQQGEVAVG